MHFCTYIHIYISSFYNNSRSKSHITFSILFQALHWSIYDAEHYGVGWWGGGGERGNGRWGKTVKWRIVGKKCKRGKEKGRKLHKNGLKGIKKSFWNPKKNYGEKWISKFGREDMSEMHNIYPWWFSGGTWSAASWTTTPAHWRGSTQGWR